MYEEKPEYLGFIDFMAAISLTFLLILSVTIIVLKENILLASKYKEDLQKSTTKIEELNSSINNLENENSDLANLLKTRPKRIIIPNELEEKVFFNSGSASIQVGFYSILDNYAEYIKIQLKAGNYNHVQVEGHTDIRIISHGHMKDNWDLGAARAIAVVRYFIKKGIPPEKLSASTYSKYHPLDGRNSENAMKLNRRIEIILQKR